MKIVYNDICIRNAENRDCEQLAVWWTDGRVMAHAGFPYGLGTNAEAIREKIQSDTDDTNRRLMIEYQCRCIGEMCYYNQGNHVAEIGIKICDTKYQEKGIGRIVLSLLINELFSMGYVKIILDTDGENVRAQHVYELLGFKRTGIHKDAWKNQIDELRTTVDYELIREDFVSWIEK